MEYLFTCCPSCGKNTITFKQKKHWVCTTCGFDMFFNVACSAGVILHCDASVIFVKRGKDPAKGMLALPGGFIDAGETAEEACKRECFEETGIKIEHIAYVASFPNTYEFKNIIYNTCDFFFTAKCSKETFEHLSAIDVEEVASFEAIDLLSVQQIQKLPIAFESVKKALVTWFLARETKDMNNR